jgi:hypothetical protein
VGVAVDESGDDGIAREIHPAGTRGKIRRGRLDGLDPISPDENHLVAADLAPVNIDQTAGLDGGKRLTGLRRQGAGSGDADGCGAGDHQD